MSKLPSVIFAPSFGRTLREIYEYLHRFSPKSANDFIDGINEQIPLIAKHPTAYPNESRLKSKRRLYRFKKYKKNYKIIFKVLKSKTIFIAVVHASRNDDFYSKLRTSSY